MLPTFLQLKAHSRYLKARGGVGGNGGICAAHVRWCIYVVKWSSEDKWFRGITASAIESGSGSGVS